MILNFKKLIIHNFLSYGHAELDLTNKHYCLVTGENKSLLDNATSNGAGKSSWSSAICWALTGETIQGLSSNIKNINIDENLCYVELEFSVDANLFKIKRYKNPKSDLKIELNGTDISGKGIRESEEILSRYLPDLTSQLISSIIILGQGLPNKFTANSPAGRKEVLEKLSKSDFMIQDLKNRISDRFQKLSKDLRDTEDTLLASATKKSLVEERLKTALDMLSNLKRPQAFDVAIVTLEQKILSIELEIKDLESEANITRDLWSKESDTLSKAVQSQQNQINEEKAEFDQFRAEYLEKRTEYLSKISAISDYVNKINSIVDICPTCKQKIPNVAKPDATKEIEEAASLQSELSKIDARFNELLNQHNKILDDIKSQNADKISKINQNIDALNLKLSEIAAKLKSLRESLIKTQVELSNEQRNKSELSNKIASCEFEISECNKTLEEIKIIIEKNSAKKQEISDRLQVISQMNTLIKRDFRGYLLSEIIHYIDAKAREYCLDIFCTDKIEFSLEGNNINISYAGKSFENLSGGEKQRIDLIIQFAIRDMMQQYLNFSSNILVLDEIFDQLDNVGCEKILELITNRLSDVESIFIISHRADELEIPNDYQLTVIKDEEGVSSIRCL